MTENFDSLFDRVVSLCEEYNTPVENLWEGNYADGDLLEEYEKLVDLAEERDDYYKVQLDQELANSIELDIDREKKYELWDIDVVEKRDILFQNYKEVGQDIRENSGLYTLSPATSYNKDGVEYQNHYFIFPNALRKNFHLTQGLLNKWGEYEYDFDLSLAVDYNRLGLPETERTVLLFEHWSGPKNLNAVRDSAKVDQVVVFGNSNWSSPEGLQDKTEFYFHQRDDEWVLQIEELLPRSGVLYEPSIELRREEIPYYTRYTHAILNEEMTECEHLDGALREYPTQEDLIKRHTTESLADGWHKSQGFDRYKLFKLDEDSITIPDYQEIIGLFHRYNPHIIEFFQGQSKQTREIELNRARNFEIESERGRLLGQRT